MSFPSPTVVQALVDAFAKEAQARSDCGSYAQAEFRIPAGFKESTSVLSQVKDIAKGLWKQASAFLSRPCECVPAEW